jgi:hypothetical protein
MLPQRVLTSSVIRGPWVMEDKEGQEETRSSSPPPHPLTLTDAACPFFHQHPQTFSDYFEIFTMTNIEPPPAATNKDQSAISSGSSTTSATVAATAPTSVNNLTRPQTDAENLLWATSNDTLRIRRDAGESSMPNDEPLLSTSSRTTISSPTVPSHSLNLIQFASAFSQFSPNSQNQALNLIKLTIHPLPFYCQKSYFPLHTSSLHSLPPLTSAMTFILLLLL